MSDHASTVTRCRRTIVALLFAATTIADIRLLLDTTFRGGIRPCVKAAAACETFQLGLTLDGDKLAEYHDLFNRLGTYPYDQAPLRPGWSPLIPNARWAYPEDARVPVVPW